MKQKMNENCAYKNESLNLESFKLKWGYSDWRSCQWWCHPRKAFAARCQRSCHLTSKLLHSHQWHQNEVFPDKIKPCTNSWLFSNKLGMNKNKRKRMKNLKLRYRTKIKKVSWAEHDALPQCSFHLHMMLSVTLALTKLMAHYDIHTTGQICEGTWNRAMCLPALTVNTTNLPQSNHMGHYIPYLSQINKVIQWLLTSLAHCLKMKAWIV